MRSPLPPIQRPAHKVAALYVQAAGVYYRHPLVDPWGLPMRDARQYNGPLPVIAHPPCSRWGRFARGGFGNTGRYKLGDDNGCFASAIEAVRTWRGILEHPQDSQAWKAYSLNAPPRAGGWIPAGDGVGWTCCVEQGHYGHVARKPTWLYAVGIQRKELKWGPAEERWRFDTKRTENFLRRAEREGVTVCLSAKQRAATPPAFRDLLISMVIKHE